MNSRANDAPPPLDANREPFEKLLNGRTPALFLDYDGTLTPIVARPELAVLDEQTRTLLRDLASALTVVIVSGRDREDVRSLVGLDNIVYAGSHGFDIRGPEGLEISNDMGEDALPALQQAERMLRESTDDIDGALIERKKFSIAVHYRNVSDDRVREVLRAVDEAVGACEGLRKGRGKKVYEIQPDIDWHKGRAVTWLIDALHIDTKKTVPIYIGDDLTDEDAFHALRQTGTGVGVLVDEQGRPSEASFRIRDAEGVCAFLRSLADAHRNAHPSAGRRDI